MDPIDEKGEVEDSNELASLRRELLSSYEPSPAIPLELLRSKLETPVKDRTLRKELHQCFGAVTNSGAVRGIIEKKLEWSIDKFMENVPWIGFSAVCCAASFLASYACFCKSSNLGILFVALAVCCFDFF
jgi:hypothetical protein